MLFLKTFYPYVNIQSYARYYNLKIYIEDFQQRSTDFNNFLIIKLYTI